jgi:alpha-L-rhamnosidase
VLVYLPYFTYLWRGETAMTEESAEAFVAYLEYLRTRVDEKGLLHIGLGDWCHTEVKKPQAPLAVTDTVISMDIANKMAVLLEAVGKTAEAEYARSEAALYREAIRAYLVDFTTMLVAGECQTSQAMALYYGVFDEAEKQAAFEKLLVLIDECGDRMDLGVLGGRVIFHVLAEYGYADLAWRMAVEQGHPSYGDLARRGATTLWESFYPENAHWAPPSLNHHFWGDISAWFIKAVAGISVAPVGGGLACEIKPAFVTALEDASAYHVTSVGKIASAWKREGDEITLTLEIPEGMGGCIALREGYTFADGETAKPAVSGSYRVIRIK